MTALNRALGAFYGLALGDALGMPTQSLSRAEMSRASSPVMRYVGTPTASHEGELVQVVAHFLANQHAGDNHTPGHGIRWAAHAEPGAPLGHPPHPAHRCHDRHGE